MGTLASRQIIHIVGPSRFQNEILADFLEKELEAKCFVSVDAQHQPPANNDQDGQTLVLLDSSVKDLENYLIGFELKGRSVPNGQMAALFNVMPGSGIEEKAISWGVRGFFYEQDSPKHFVKGISAIFKGEMWYPRDVMSKYILSMHNKEIRKKEDVSLTHRELEILTMVITGSKNQDIASHLFISAHTVKTHLYNIFRKINVPNRLQAALWAAKNL